MFTDVTVSAGVVFTHQSPRIDERLANVAPWMTSIHAGVAVGDFDNDGLEDLYVLNSRAGTPNALFRNNGHLTFTEVGELAGVARVNEGGMVSIDALFGDIDNDGDQDLFIAGYGGNRLFRNDRGRFTDVTRAAHLDRTRDNASAAVFFDYDGDGWLDLFVVSYFPPVDLRHPETFDVLQNSFSDATNGGSRRLFRNTGGQAFEEVTDSGLIGTSWVLDVGTGDLDGDGRPDVYVANDYGTDLVFRNDGAGHFNDVTAQATGGDHDAGMNVEVGDFNGDGRQDVYVTNITNRLIRQGNMLWQNAGGFRLINVAREAGVLDGGWGWCAKFLDADNDGDLDLYTVNGYVSLGPIDLFDPRSGLYGKLPLDDPSDARRWPPLHGLSISGYERNRFFRNDGGTFTEVGEAAGVALLADGRGIAVADFDNDGDLDLFVTNVRAPAVLFRNDSAKGRHWLEVTLVGSTSNRDAIGASIAVSADGQEQVREINSGNGFSAQSTRRAVFGLGAATMVERLTVRWPGGITQVLTSLAVDRHITVREPASSITFNGDIAPILFRHCTGCHRPGEVAPFPLLTYRDAASRAVEIARAVASGHMPPWKPVAGFGRFRGERRLTPAEIELVARWAGEGAPAGREEMPLAPADPEPAWRLGVPDLVASMPEPYEVPATGDDVYRCFVIPLDLPDGRFVSAIEFHPGNRRVLHHSIVFVDTSGAARRLDEAEPGPGYRSYGGPGFMPAGALGGWAPGSTAYALPDGVGKMLPRRADLVLHNHYHPSGVRERDRSEVGIHFSRTTPARQSITVPILRRDLAIPAGAVSHHVTTFFVTPVAMDLIGVFPHMHEIGREMKVAARTPDGREIPIVWIKDWDPHWQGEYMYDAPVRLPAGTRIVMDATYDNSAGNRRNPHHPPRDVWWGNDAADEMALCMLQVAVGSAEEARRIARAILTQPGLNRIQ